MLRKSMRTQFLEATMKSITYAFHNAGIRNGLATRAITVRTEATLNVDINGLRLG